MRARPSEYELVAPGSLPAVLELLASEPGAWMPIAGGTELMVQYGAGRLSARKLVSLWGLPELRTIESTAQEVLIGAGCTYTDLRNHPVVAQEFPLLARAASWTGSIANQNRGTLGGNIVNGSPAADSLPALLVYEAELLLASARGTRRLPYVKFHTVYKQNNLAADEIIRAIALQPRFAGYHAYSRKVGTRNAQAIAKLCLSGLAKTSGNKIEDVRLAIGSMAVTPMRLRKTEQALAGREWSGALVNGELISEARQALESEVAPIDDIRSSALYRLHVAGNLLQEFLEGLFA
jgi:CO/xanthine dehydrogenase FAD-binding subunit